MDTDRSIGYSSLRALRPSGRGRGRRAAAGFTLLELMVVLVILALLTTIAAPEITKHLRKAKAQTANIQVDALGSALDAFQLDMGRFPSAAEGLAALVDRPASAPQWDGPYIKKRDSLTDPWGKPYLYRVPGQHGAVDVYSLGADQREGGESDSRDVGNW